MTILCTVDNEVSFDKQLLHCIRSKNDDEVRSLLENEDIRELRDSSKATLLHFAAEYGNSGITQYLIDKGLDVNAQDKLEKTPLLYALSVNQDDISEETIGVLLRANANIFVTDSFGATALQIVVYWKLFRVIDVVAMILKRLASECGNNEELIVAKLLEAECSLERATLLRNPSILRLMLEKGSPVDERHPRLGHTALHAAVHLMDLDIVRLLVEHGADVNAKDSKGRIPLYYYNYYEMHEVQRPEIVGLVVDESTRLTELEDNGLWMQLSSVLTRGNNEAVEILLGCDIDYSARNRQGKTVLHFLAARKEPIALEELEGKEIDVNARDGRDNTPLFNAAYVKNVSMVKFLLENGAEVNVENGEGHTPLSYAYYDVSCVKTHDKIVELFFEYGGSIFMIDTERSVFDIAKESRKFDFVKTLLANLAILYKLGEDPLYRVLLSQISAHEMFENHFDSCLRKLDKMDNIVINDAMTMFTILTEPVDRVVYRCIYNSTLLSRLESMRRKSHSNFYYFGILQKRLDEIVDKIRLIQDTAFVVSKILGLHNNENHIVVHEIVNYLGYEDMLIVNELKYT